MSIINKLHEKLKKLFARFWVQAIEGRKIYDELLFLEDILRLLKLTTWTKIAIP